MSIGKVDATASKNAPPREENAKCAEIGVETGAVYIPQVLYWILEDEAEVHANLEEKQLVLDSLNEYRRLLDPGLSIEPY